jgi:hypothetical protein
MSRCLKLLEAAKASPNNFRFDDLCALAECYGWVYRRQRGSHVIYENTALPVESGRVMNFQDKQGKAKPYQVKELLAAITLVENTDGGNDEEV